MKKAGITIIAVITMFSGITAQNIDDALRYSQVFYGGTARFTSMGGAFTALGGDLSTLSQNPAGLGIYRSSELTISPQLFHINNVADFTETSTDYQYNFNLGQAGVVFNFINNENETGLVTLNFGYSFNKTNNLNNAIRIQGAYGSSSMADYWADRSYNLYTDELSGDAPDAFLAYDTWVIDTLPGEYTQYGTVFSNYGDNPPALYGQNIRRLISQEGYTGEHAFSVGGNYSNKIYFGATLGISRLNFISHFEHLESTDYDLPSKFSDFNYTLHYEQDGTGYALKLGAIVKPVEPLRIGVAFHSPTLYRINEYLYDNMTSNFTDGGKFESSNEPNRYNYTLTTPFRVLAGVSYQIQKIAILSADYEFVDYRTARFSKKDAGWVADANELIKYSLRSASNIRLGGEIRLSKFYLRGGYGYYGKAFMEGEENEDLDQTSVSCGAGFREQNLALDFGFANYKSTEKYILYTSSLGSPIADLNSSRNIFTMSFSYKFGY